jgi:hypothetical protein
VTFSQSMCMDEVCTSLRRKFQGQREPSCVLYGLWCGGSSLDSIAKDFWDFPLIQKGFLGINSCVLVHGYSSCDIDF